MRFLKQVFGKSSSSRNVAKERLQLVLVHDRAQISPGMLQVLKDEIIAVISKHLSINNDAVEITFTQNRRETRLQADIPLERNRQRAAK
jgi:cell division topological specificity factor